MLRTAAIPAGIVDRLTKAIGHRNAVERWLWRDTPRGFWSARQAEASYAEIWLHLAGSSRELPPVQPKLAASSLTQAIDRFVRQLTQGPVLTAWRALRDAEAAILAEPFPDAAASLDREVLQAGLARKYRYLDAMRRLCTAIEEEIVAAYPQAAGNPFGEPELAEVVQTVLDSPSVWLFESLHVDGAIPDQKLAATRVADEIGRALDSLAVAEGQMLRSECGLSHAQVVQEAGLQHIETLFPDLRPDPFAAIVTFGGPSDGPRHLVEVAGRWDAQTCLGALLRLRRLFAASRCVCPGDGSLQVVGLHVVHTHDHRKGDPSWESLDDGRLSLEALIRSEVAQAICAVGSASPVDSLLSARLDGYAMDCSGLVKGAPDGAMTRMFIWFQAPPPSDWSWDGDDLPIVYADPPGTPTPAPTR